MTENQKEKNIKTLNPEECLRLSSVFSVFADPMRLNIIYVLLQKEMCVSDIAEALNTTTSNISHHLSILKNNDLITYRKNGKQILYSLSDEHVKALFDTGLVHIEEKYR